MMRLMLTPEQASHVSTYATESVHECESMRLDGLILTVLDAERAIEDLIDASNSADETKVSRTGAVLLRVARKIRSSK